MVVIDSGTGSDSPEMHTFSMLAGMRSRSEVFSLEREAAAYERMMSGKARFRVVLNSGQ
jgi:D-arabinose 1-dehydrogenase-like Zn-dependent alcohol dehydrogenase